MQIPLNLIDADPEQPRQCFPESELQELVESIRTQGILTPLIVEKDYTGESTGRYLLLDGERRYRSAKRLNLETVPVVIFDGPLSFADRTIKRFHIQEQHHNWSIFDKARAIAAMKQRSKLTFAEIAEQLNMQAPLVHNWVSVTEFTAEGQASIVEKKIRFTYLIYLIRAVKRYVELTQRPQGDIEKQLIARLVHGDLGTVSDMTEFSQLLFSDKYAIEKVRFLDDDSYSLADFFSQTGSTKILLSEKICRLSEELQTALTDNVSTLSTPAKEALQTLFTTLSNSHDLV